MPYEDSDSDCIREVHAIFFFTNYLAIWKFAVCWQLLLCLVITLPRRHKISDLVLL